MSFVFKMPIKNLTLLTACIWLSACTTVKQSLEISETAPLSETTKSDLIRAHWAAQDVQKKLQQEDAHVFFKKYSPSIKVGIVDRAFAKTQTVLDASSLPSTLGKAHFSEMIDRILHLRETERSDQWAEANYQVVDIRLGDLITVIYKDIDSPFHPLYLTVEIRLMDNDYVIENVWNNSQLLNTNQALEECLVYSNTILEALIHDMPTRGYHQKAFKHSIIHFFSSDVLKPTDYPELNVSKDIFEFFRTAEGCHSCRRITLQPKKLTKHALERYQWLESLFDLDYETKLLLLPSVDPKIPGDPGIDIAKAHYLAKLDRLEEAMNAITRAIKMAPNYPLSYAMAISFSESLGDAETARILRQNTDLRFDKERFQAIEAYYQSML